MKKYNKHLIFVVLLMILGIFVYSKYATHHKSTSHIYFGTYNGLVYKDNTLILGKVGVLSPDNSEVGAILMESGVLYVGTGSGSVYKVVNGMWYQIGDAEAIPWGHAPGYVSSIAVVGDTIYAGGSNGVDDDGGVVFMASLSGGGWTKIGATSAIDAGCVNSIAVNGNKVYAAGLDINGGGIVNAITLPDGKWGSVTESYAIPGGAVNSMLIHSESIYIAGYDGESNGIVLSAPLSGGKWQIVGRNFQKSFMPGGRVTSIAIADDKIYAGGNSHANTGVVMVAPLATGEWKDLDSDSLSKKSSINSIAISNNKIYAVGADNKGNGVVQSKLLSKGVWKQYLEPKLSEVLSVATRDQNLYIGTKDSVMISNAKDLSWKPVVFGALDGTEITGLVLYGNKIYASTKKSVYAQSGNGWELIGNKDILSSGSLSAIAVANNNIYVSGIDSSGYGKVKVLSLDKKQWYDFESEASLSTILYNSIAIDGDNMYVAGNRGSKGVIKIASLSKRKWESSIDNLSLVSGQSDRGVYSLVISGKYFYAIGIGSGVIMRALTDDKWKPVANDLSSDDGVEAIYQMAVDGDTVYVKASSVSNVNLNYMSQHNRNWEFISDICDSYSTSLPVSIFIFSN